MPQWDPVILKKAREALQALFALEGLKGPRFGRKDEVEPNVSEVRDHPKEPSSFLRKKPQKANTRDRT